MSFRDKNRERAKRIKDLGIATVRANAGTIQDIADMAADAFIDGDSPRQVMEKVRAQAEAIAQARYRPKIVAALARGGIQVRDDQQFSANLLSEIVAERSGLDLNTVELTPDGVLDAIDKLIAGELSRALKVPLATLADVDGLKAALDVAVRNALRDGTAQKLLTKGATLAVRRIATWKRAGIPAKIDQRRIKQRLYQKKYARTHKEIWVPR